MVPGESRPILGTLFRLTYVQNPGGVFGLRFGGACVHLVFAVGALAAVGLLLWRTPPAERLVILGLALVLGGAVGNAIDRVRLGVVVDFLDFGVAGFRWWVFNVADACVTTGTGLLVLFYGRQRREGSAPNAGSGDTTR